MIRVVAADDHPVVLSGLEQLLRGAPDVMLVATCRDGAEAMGVVRQLRPDVLLTDVRMPHATGLEVARTITAERLATRCLLLSGVITPEQAAVARTAGAAGVLLKEAAPDLLLDAIRRVHAGEPWVELTPAGAAAADAPAQGVTALLTRRELELALLVAGGHRNRDIARALGIAEGTAKIHLASIYRKLGVNGRVELAARLHREGLA